jgi:cobalt-zinc-cadmium efflux system outer membrane protein
VFNANRGNIEKAQSEISKTESDNRHAMLTMSAEMKKAKQQMDAAYFQAETLNEKIMPSANKAFRLAREGYGLGRFPYLEVLDAQRSLFDVKQQYIASLKEFHTSKAQVERLIATHLPKIKDKGVTNAE